MERDGRHEDERLTRLLASVRADADPVLWTRVRARIEAGERVRVPAWVAWAMRPAALAASFALFAVAVSAAVTLVVTTPRVSTQVASSEDLADALVVELDSSAGASGAATVPAVAGDSGAVR